MSNRKDVTAKRIAYFVSPHGFGHATRAAAVMSALQGLDQTIEFEVYTTVPRWLFRDSLDGQFIYRLLLTDIGLEQKTPLQVDLPNTIKSLNAFLPFDQVQVASLADEIITRKCEMVICDISPLGIQVAKEAGIPAILTENFTWDWIYQNYLSCGTEMETHISYLQGIFHSADHHIQVEPYCNQAEVDLVTRPVSRKPRSSLVETREKLGIPSDAEVVLITISGMQDEYGFLAKLKDHGDVYFVLPGGVPSVQVDDNVILLPHHSEFFHPDLISASDVVIGKVGYSTLAEVYHAGVPFGYITRPNFRESDVLTDYIRKSMNGTALTEAEFEDGDWLYKLPVLLAFPRVQRDEINGAMQVAEFVNQLFTY